MNIQNQLQHLNLMKNILSSLFVLLAGMLTAQEILPEYRRLPDGIAGSLSPYAGGSFRFTVDDGNLAQWSWTMAPGEVDDIASSGLTLLNDGTVSGTPAGGTGGTTYDFIVTANRPALGWTQTKQYSLVVQSAACSAVTRDYILVMDLSGSMSVNDNGTPAMTRWNRLQETVRTFMPVLRNFVASTDRIGAVYFNGMSARTKLVMETFSTRDWRSNADINAALFTGESPSGLTPMGDGLQDAIGMLWASNNRTLIVFTDGMQNVAPELLGPDYETIEPAIDISADGVNQGIKILTIGIGAGTAQADMLRKTANPDEWFTQSDLVNAATLNTFFTSTIPASQQNCTPRIVDLQTGKLRGENVLLRDTFVLNRFVGKLVVRVQTLSSHSALGTCTLQQPATDFTAMPSIQRSDMVLYELEFPVRRTSSLLEGDGTWELTFSGTNGAEYEITVLINDEYVHTGLTTDREGGYFTGDPVTVTASVSFAGKAIDDASVMAYLLKPGEDLGHLAAVTTVPLAVSPEVFTLPGQLKIQTILADTNLIKKLMPFKKPIPLTPQGNGTYKGTFTDTDVSGTYRLLAFFQGENPNAGVYQGLEAKCVLVDFAHPNDISLNPQVQTLPRGRKGIPYTHILQFTPTNRFKRRIGPAQEQRIRVQLSQGTVDTLVDRLDGTYVAGLKIPAGVNPGIRVFVIDQQTPVLTTTLRDLQCAGVKRFGLLANGGLTQPTGDLDTLYDAGGFLELGASYRFNCSWAAEVVAGYYGFKSGFSILGASVFGVYSRNNLFGSGNYIGRLAAGAGVFVPKNEDATAGFAVKLGLHKPVSSRSEVGVDFAYYHLPKPGYSFLGIGLGYRYYF